METDGSNNWMFIFELDGDKEPLNKNLPTVQQQDVFSEAFSNKIHCLPYIFEFEMFPWK